MLEKVLPVLREKYEGDSFATRTAMSDLGIAYHGVGRLEEATALHTETLQYAAEGPRARSIRRPWLP